MSMSTPESKLAAALSAFLGDVKDPALDGVNPHFRSKYASLPGVLQAVRPLLAKHKLAVTQAPEIRDGKLVMLTRLMHADGEVIDSAMPLPESTNMQALGSAMTYARRYSLTALLGVAGDEDDDGNASTPAPPTKATITAKAQPTPPPPANHEDVPFPNGIDPAADDVVLVADWTETPIPAGKHKGKLLSELQPTSAEWFAKNYKAKHPGDMQFRAALNACARALNFSKTPSP